MKVNGRCCEEGEAAGAVKRKVASGIEFENNPSGT